MRLVHVDEPLHSEKFERKKAKAILKVKPDVILFEYPTGFVGLNRFNRFKPNNKPSTDLAKMDFEKSSKRHPWLKSGYLIIDAIEKLWKQGKQVYLFHIDAPFDLTAAGSDSEGVVHTAWIYLREKYMIKNIRAIVKRTHPKTVLLFCHNLHWRNLQFLMKNPSKNEIWAHYFNGSKQEYASPRAVRAKLNESNTVLYKYWKLKSDWK